MAKSKKAVAAEQPIAEEVEVVEAVVEAGAENDKKVTFSLNEYAADDELDLEDEDDDEDLEDDEDLVGAVAQVSQLLMTEDGEAVADVLRGILDALDKQNKILFRGLQLLETRR